MDESPGSKVLLFFRNVATFLRAIVRHWQAFIVGVFLESLSVWFWQNEGHTIPHWAYWLAGVVGVIFASFRAWEDERHKAATLSAEVEQLRGNIAQLSTPVLEVACGDNVKGSMARDRPAPIFGRIGLVDFFGFVLTNVSAKTVHRCHCDLVLLERVDQVEPLFKEFTALPFAPRDPEQELATEIDIRSGESIPVSLCTIIDTNRVRFGSMGNKWRFPERFEEFFTQPGDYIFHVNVTGDDCPTLSVRFDLVWTGRRETSIVKLVTKS